MKNSAFVSMEHLDSAVSEVQDELYRIGLWNEFSRLPKTSIFWCNLPQITMLDADGFFIHKNQSPTGSQYLDALLDYQVGNIYIPQWILSNGFWKNRFPLRDVVRHEYGHAVAHHYPQLIQRSSYFSSVFAGCYWSTNANEYDPNKFVSDYSATMPMEDFAETFMFFVRHEGRLLGRFYSRHIKRKWKFVAELCDVIDSGAAKW